MTDGKVTIGGNTVWVNPGSVAKYTLMQDDYLIIRFNSYDKPSFSYGASIDGSEFPGVAPIAGKKYAVLQPPSLSYDQAMGAWRCDLRLDAQYMRMKDYMFMLVDNNKRVEAKWTLTGTLEEHLAVMNANLAIVMNGWSCGIVEGSALDEAVRTIEYDCKTLFDALCIMADKWYFDWWVEADGTINIGRLESEEGGTSVNIGEEAKNVTSNNANGKYATKVYAFGGTRNMFSAMGKSLVFTVGSGSERKNGRDITDPFRTMTIDMFKNVEKASVNAEPVEIEVAQLNTIGDVRGSGYKLNSFTGLRTWFEPDSFSDEEHRPANPGIETDLPRMKVVDLNKQQSMLFSFGDGAPSGKLVLNMPLYCMYRKDKTYSEEGDNTLTIAYDVIVSDGKAIRVVGTREITLNSEDYDTKSMDKLMVGWYYFEEEAEIDVDVSNVTGVIVKFYVPASESYSNGAFILYSTSDQSYSVTYSNASIVSANDCARIKVKIEESEYNATFNPLGVNRLSEDYAMVWLDNATVDAGTQYEIIDGIKKSRISGSWFAYDGEDIKLAVGEARLRLPDPGYVGEANGIEEAVVFDDIFPSLNSSVTSVDKVTRTRTVTDDGGTRVEKFAAYVIGSDSLSGFSADYIPKDGDLNITFGAPAGGEGDTASILDGMTFGVNYDDDNNAFEIIANDTYGIFLPNESFYPSVGDTFVLWGYDAEFISDGMLADAQERLKARAEAYLEKLKHNDRSYTVTLNPSFAAKHMPALGELLALDEGSFRVIGYEIKLDIPEDDPVYTCGEQSKYSRLTTIERLLRGR